MESKTFTIPVNSMTPEEAEKKLVELIQEYNSIVDFNDETGDIKINDPYEDLPPLKEVVEFTDDDSSLLKDVSAQEIKKTE